MKSGRKSWIQIYDKTGNLVYESDGKNLSEFNKYYFEKNFGPVENYERKLIIKEEPFPFRAWFSAAVGVPIGVILLFSFIVRAYISLFYPEEEKEKKQKDSFPRKTESLSPIQYIINYFSSLNIFIIGFLIFLAIFLYWVIPNLFVFIGKLGMDTLKEYRWIFLGVVSILLGLFIWMIYLKYLLAKKTIESQTAIEKHRIQIEFQQAEVPHQLEYKEETGEKSPIPPEDWEEADIIHHDMKQDDPDLTEETPLEKSGTNGPKQSS
jgi:hypothetical protein